ARTELERSKAISGSRYAAPTSATKHAADQPAGSRRDAVRAKSPGNLPETSTGRPLSGQPANACRTPASAKPIQPSARELPGGRSRPACRTGPPLAGQGAAGARNLWLDCAIRAIIGALQCGAAAMRTLLALTFSTATIAL